MVRGNEKRISKKRVQMMETSQKKMIMGKMNRLNCQKKIRIEKDMFPLKQLIPERLSMMFNKPIIRRQNCLNLFTVRALLLRKMNLWPPQNG